MGGLGSSVFKADINLQKVSFAAGETMTINLGLDNSKCKKPIKVLKAKLMRKVECLGSGRVVWSREQELSGKKFPGCSAKVNETKIISFDIPEFEEVGDIAGILQPGCDKLILANSSETGHFRIEYSVLVYIKHDGLTERGKGNFKKFDIEIKSAPQALPEVVRQKESNWMTAQGITQW